MGWNWWGGVPAPEVQDRSTSGMMRFMVTILNTDNPSDFFVGSTSFPETNRLVSQSLLSLC